MKFRLADIDVLHYSAIEHHRRHIASVQLTLGFLQDIQNNPLRARQAITGVGDSFQQGFQLLGGSQTIAS